MKLFFFIAIVFVLLNSTIAIANTDFDGKKPGPGDQREADPVDGKKPGPGDQRGVFAEYEVINGEEVVHLTFLVD